MSVRRVAAAGALVVGVFALLLLTRTLPPIIGFPGGALAGTDEAKPAQWGARADVGTVQLETRPDAPYSVNVWGVAIGPDYYIATRPQGTVWSKNIDVNANVRLRVDGTVFSLKAVGVTDEQERRSVLHAYAEKYAADPADMAVNAGLIYRLDPR